MLGITEKEQKAWNLVLETFFGEIETIIGQNSYIIGKNRNIIGQDKNINEQNGTILWWPGNDGWIGTKMPEASFVVSS